MGILTTPKLNSTLVIYWRIRPNDRLFHLWAFIFGEDGGCDMEAANLVCFRKLKTELFGVMVDILDTVKL